jgi:hypothetical protein
MGHVKLIIEVQLSSSGVISGVVHVSCVVRCSLFFSRYCMVSHRCGGGQNVFPAAPQSQPLFSSTDGRHVR